MTFKATLNLLMLILVIGMLSSCKSSIPLASTNTTKTVTVKEIVHDTFIKVEKDSSYYKALLKCIEGKVVVKEIIKEVPGKHIAPPKVTINNDQLEVDCEARARELLLEWKSKQKTEVITIEKNIPYPVERELTFFQKLFIWCGKILLLLLLILGVGWILKIKKLITL